MKKVRIEQDGIKVRGELREEGEDVWVQEGAMLDILTRENFAEIVDSKDKDVMVLIDE